MGIIVPRSIGPFRVESNVCTGSLQVGGSVCVVVSHSVREREIMRDIKRESKVFFAVACPQIIPQLTLFCS